MKYLPVLVIFLLMLSEVSAQKDLKLILPLDPQVRTGVLPNGLRYYIRKNNKPEKRAELRLAVNAGSTSENDDQQGLAHMTEHMAFNGTKNFKKSEIIDYLESVGTKFGPHLNAYTSFDETVYMIQLPTDSPSILDKGLQILEEWSHNLLFDSLEVEKERGVVVEEWRLGQGAEERMRRKFWPVLFQDSRYAVRLPIGKKEIIENCKQSTLRSFYKNWYRPDLMAVVAVGDFDVDQMETKIIKQFSAVPVKSAVPQLVSYPVPDIKELKIVTVSDKEARMGRVQLFYKQAVEPVTTEGDYRKTMAQELFTSMVNSRLSELQHQPDPPFIFSRSGFGRLVRTKNSYNSVAGCKEDGIARAFEAILTENERVRRFGFKQTELQRQKAEMMSQVEKAFAERDKSESSGYARECVSYFLSKEPMPGIEYEYGLYKKYLEGITLKEVNALAKKWITTNDNCVVIVTAPEKPSTKMPSQDRIHEIIDHVGKAELSPYDDKVVNEPLVEGTLQVGSVVNTKRNTVFNTTEWTLANGLKVVIKPTDFKNDEILFTSYAWGGWSLYPEKDFLSAATADDIVEESGIGKFDATSLDKALSGKIAGCSPYIGDLQQGFNGSCAPKDLETLMQLIHEYFINPRQDSNAFHSFMEKRRSTLLNRNADPQSIFADTISYVMSGYNYRYRPQSLEMLKEINFERVFEIYRERFSDASGFTFYFVGNFNIDDLKHLAEKYLGSLPSVKKNETWKDNGIRPPSGKIEKTVIKGEAPRSTVMLRYNMPFEFNREHRNELNVLMKLMNIRLRESLREDKSSVYGVSCSGSPRHFPFENLEVTIYFSCAPSNVNMLVNAVKTIIDEVQEQGCNERNLQKIKETALRERETGLKENQFWLNTISSNDQNGENLLDLQKYNDWVNNLKEEDFKLFAAKYLSENNFAKFVLMPEK